MSIIDYRIQLLIDFYNPCTYRGVYYKLGEDGNVRQFEKNTFGTKAQQAKGIKPKFPFKLRSAIASHIKKDINFAMLFNKTGTGCIIAFDLDSKDCPEELLKDVRKFITIIRRLDIEPLVYHSGGKGYHIEIRTEQPTPIKDLSAISKWLRDKAIAAGVKFMDRFYPYQKPAYRIFGSCKLSNRNFTKILTHGGLIVDEEENWKRFKHHMKYNSVPPPIIEKLIELSKPPQEEKPEIPEQKKKTPSAANTSRSDHGKTRFTINSLVEFYHNGLTQSSQRHEISYQIGRLFKYYLNLSEEEAVQEIRKWVDSHFNGIFKAEYISSNREEAILDSINQIKDAYLHSLPFDYTIEVKATAFREYVSSLKLTRTIAASTEYILTMMQTYKRFLFTHSQEQFAAGWELSQNGAKKRINALMKAGLLTKLEEGSHYSGKANLYRISIPRNCYELVEKEVKEIATATTI